ncbi:MAG: hypothetical protein ACFFBL_13275 [Promethearchaeota archaeon]
MEEDEPDLETAFKVVAIMQTITEDLDEEGKRAWRKMLGLAPTIENAEKKEKKQSND